MAVLYESISKVIHVAAREYQKHLTDKLFEDFGNLRIRYPRAIYYRKHVFQKPEAGRQGSEWIYAADAILADTAEKIISIDQQIEKEKRKLQYLCAVLSQECTSRSDYLKFIPAAVIDEVKPHLLDGHQSITKAMEDEIKETHGEAIDIILSNLTRNLLR